MNQQDLDRRTLLKLGLLSAAGAIVPIGCGGSSSQTSTILKLSKVDVDQLRVTRLIAGLRPFRKSGFVVKSESFGPKTVIHNYGHGGCGVSLSWGTADLAASLALATGERKAAVIGSGVAGLTSARILQDRGFEVTLYAKDLLPNTTSNVAAAMWAPVTLDSAGFRTPAYLAQLQHACRFAFTYFQSMIGARYGIRYVPMYFVGNDPQAIPWDYIGVNDLTPLMPVPASENPFPTPHACKFTTMFIETPVFLPAIEQDFLLRGGKVVVQDFSSLAEVLALPETVILNCTGLGSKALFGDPELTPIKGQLTILLPQPEVTYGYVDGQKDTYMFPRSDGIILGGSHEEGVWDTTPSTAEAERIFKLQKDFFDHLA